MQNRMKIDCKKAIIVYLVVFGALMLVYCSVNTPKVQGEWDDYSFPIASILNDHNFSISDDDIAYYKELFPNWAKQAKKYSFSGYTTRDGSGELTWYFPVYAIVCIPFVFILGCLDLPTVYTFSYTNLFFLMLSVCLVNKYIKTDDKSKNLLVMLLTLNPIVFYVSWPSAEVFIYSMLVIGLMCWYNKWYRRAAIFVSIAGMLNPTIMSIGIVMIIEYLCGLIENKNRKQTWITFFKEKSPVVVKYGCCYIIGIIPMIYNFYHIGHINLTASLSGFTNGNESAFSRFMAYLFDLSFGIFPYFTIILIVSLVFLFAAIVKKNISYIEWIFTFYINILLYSLMVHINSGMSGIARYNSWGALLLIFAVTLMGRDMLSGPKMKKMYYSALMIGLVCTTMIIFSYGPFMASKTTYVKFTPIAEWTLDHIPALYNPLKSTFVSRTLNFDGGYTYDTPVVYVADDGHIRKILASEDNREELLESYISCNDSAEGFINQINNLKGIGYISLSKDDAIAKVPYYEPGSVLSFSTEDKSGLNYIAKGIGKVEDWGVWSEGDKLIMHMRMNTQAEVLHCEITASAYNDMQSVKIYVNNQAVYQNPEYMGDGIQFDFLNPGIGKPIEFAFELPNGRLPSQFGHKGKNVSGLGLSQMVITSGSL